MKKIVLIFLIALLSTFKSNSQVSWEKLFSKQSTDVFRSVQEVPGGGYVVAGYTADSTANDTDGYAVRLNPNGDTIWTYTYNGPLSKKDLFYKVICTSDGGFAICGYTNSVTGVSDDALFIKLNPSGKEQWTKTFGSSGIERAQDIIEVSDGFTICGYSTSSPAQYYDALIIHIDTNGNVLWTKTIGDVNYDDSNSIKQLSDGGYILGGQSNNSTQGLDQFLIRTNSSGDTLWTRRFGTIGTENIESLTVTSDGYVLVGSTNSLGRGDDGYIVKTDLNGSVQWTKIYGGSDQDDFHRIEKTTDGGFIVAGTTASYGPLNPNMWLLKTDANGDSTWAYTFGGDNHDHGYSAVQTSDGGYIIAGHSGSFGFNNEDGYIVKLGPNGTGMQHLKYVSAYSMVSPTCAGTASEVKVLVRNFGNTSVSNFQAHVQISGAITQTLNATFSGTLAAHDVTTITFSPTINTVASPGALTFFGYTDVVNDVYPQNNSFTTTTTLSVCTGIEDLKADLGYSLYPNPSSGKIMIDFSSHYNEVTIEVMNITGSIVKKVEMNNSFGKKQLIDLSLFPRGIYLIKVTTNEGYNVKRVIVE